MEADDEEILFQSFWLVVLDETVLSCVCECAILSPFGKLVRTSYMIDYDTDSGRRGCARASELFERFLVIHGSNCRAFILPHPLLNYPTSHFGIMTSWIWLWIRLLATFFYISIGYRLGLQSADHFAWYARPYAFHFMLFFSFKANAIGFSQSPVFWPHPTWVDACQKLQGFPCCIHSGDAQVAWCSMENQLLQVGIVPTLESKAKEARDVQNISSFLRQGWEGKLTEMHLDLLRCFRV